MKKETKRIVGIILPITLFSILLTSVVISVTNDMYAFVKPEREVTVVIERAHTVEDISMLLYDKNVIENPFIFTAYVNSKHKKADVENFYGEIVLDSSMSYREILAVFL